MRKFVLMILLIQFICSISFCQTKRIKIETYSGRSYKGYILKADSNALVLAKGWSKKRLKKGAVEQIVIQIADIETIKLKGNSQTLAGSMIGLSGGLIIGSTRGATLNENHRPSSILFKGPFETKNKSIQTGFNLAIVGAIIGGIVGSFARKNLKKYSIHGDIQLFNLYKPAFL